MLALSIFREEYQPIQQKCSANVKNTKKKNTKQSSTSPPPLATFVYGPLILLFVS